MDVSQTPRIDVPNLTGGDRVEEMWAKLQVALLKKTLQTQQEEAETLRKMAEGKGQILDIRV